MMMCKHGTTVTACRGCIERIELLTRQVSEYAVNAEDWRRNALRTQELMEEQQSRQTEQLRDARKQALQDAITVLARHTLKGWTWDYWALVKELQSLSERA